MLREGSLVCIQLRCRTACESELELFNSLPSAVMGRAYSTCSADQRVARNPANTGSVDEFGCAKLARIPYPCVEKRGRARAAGRLRRVADHSAKTDAIW